jgi:hypothetical protein
MPDDDSSGKPAVGRSNADAVVELFKSWPIVLAVLLALTTVLAGLVIGLFIMVRDAAEPGTTIKLYGLEVQKAKAIPPAPAPPPVADEVSTYMLPNKEIIGHKAAMAILDGTIAVQSDSFNGESFGRLLGEGFNAVKIAARKVDGTPAWLYREGSGQTAIVDLPAYVEVEHLRRVFGITLVPSNDGHHGITISVEQKRRATLNLTSVEKLKSPPLPSE